MKSKEEIQQLANDYWEGCDGCDANDKYFFVKGFECAYRQLGEDITDKKYTEEALHTILKLRREWYSHTDKNVVRDFINSLNKQD